MSATYNLEDRVGQVRLEIPDTDIDNPIFSDAEVRYLLHLHGNQITVSAAHALDIIAGDPKRLAQWSRGSVSGVRNSAAEVQARADRLRAESTSRVGFMEVERGDFW